VVGKGRLPWNAATFLIRVEHHVEVTNEELRNARGCAIVATLDIRTGPINYIHTPDLGIYRYKDV